MSLDIQWITIAVMLLAGAGMGILFDSYRVVSEHFKWPRWSLSIMDMLYWITSAVIIFRLLYLANYGEVRGYVFIGLVFGVLSYGLFISQYYSRFVLVIIRFIERLIQLFMKVIDYIIIKPLLLLYKIVIYCLKFGTKITTRTIQIVLQLVLPVINVLFLPLRPLYRPAFRYIGHKINKHIIPLLKKWTWLVNSKRTTTKWFKLLKNWIYS